MGNLPCCEDSGSLAPKTQGQYASLIDVCFATLAGKGQTLIKRDGGFHARYLETMQKIRNGKGLLRPPNSDEEWEKVALSLREGAADQLDELWSSLVRPGALKEPHHEEAPKGADELHTVSRARFEAWFHSEHGIGYRYSKKCAVPAPCSRSRRPRSP